MPWQVRSASDPVSITQRLSRLGPNVPLSEVCDVVRGKRIPKGDGSAKDGIPLVGRSILSNGFLDLENAARVKIDITTIPEKYLLSPGDILLSMSVTETFGAVLNESCETAVISAATRRPCDT